VLPAQPVEYRLGFQRRRCLKKRLYLPPHPFKRVCAGAQ
jgi:hypothetical protein